MNRLCQIALYLLLTSTVSAQNTWTQLTSLNASPRSACVGFALYNDGYIGLGSDISGAKRGLKKYDPSMDSWSNEESLGGENGGGLERTSAVSFVINNMAYVGLGQGVAPYNQDMWQYDPLSDSWTQVANFMGSARTQAVAFGIDSLGYVGTGIDAGGYQRDFYSYNPNTNTWTQLNDFGGTARAQAVGFSMGGQGYVGTGDDGFFRNDFWQYEPSTDTWTEKASFPGTPRTGATGWGIFPNAYVATGYDNTLSYKKDVWTYNQFGDIWQQKTDLPGPARSQAVSFAIGGKGYLGTGFDNSHLDDFYVFDATLDVGGLDNPEILVYPNPSSNGVFRMKATWETLTVYNGAGNLVRTFGPGNTTVDLSDQPAGAYYAVSEEGRSARLVIAERR